MSLKELKKHLKNQLTMKITKQLQDLEMKLTKEKKTKTFTALIFYWTLNLILTGYSNNYRKQINRILGN